MINPTTYNCVLGFVCFFCLIVAGVYWCLAGSAELGHEAKREEKFNITARVFLIVAVVAVILLLVRLFVL